MDVVDQERTGLLVPDEGEEPLAAAIVRLLTDAGLRAQFGQTARRAALDRFGYERLVTDLDALYRAALEVRRGPAGRAPMA